MSGSQGSMFVRRQLGVRIRDVRKKAGKTTLDVEETGIVSRMTLHRIEIGLQSTKPGTVIGLCELYGADRDTIDALVALAKASRGSGWFEGYGDAVPRRLGLYLSAELAAERISIYDPEVIPGALQTPEYARALFQGESPQSSPDHINRLLEVRQKRIAHFWSGRPSDATLIVVLNEAALARDVGGHATMKHQRSHLKEVSGQRGTEVRILPWEVGAHPAIYGGYTIFEFADPDDPTVVYVESYTGGQFLEDDLNVGRIREIQNRIFDTSVPIE